MVRGGDRDPHGRQEAHHSVRPGDGGGEQVRVDLLRGGSQAEQLGQTGYGGAGPQGLGSSRGEKWLESKMH